MKALQSSRVYIAIDVDDDQLAAVQQLVAALVVIAGAVLLVGQAVAAVTVWLGDVRAAAGWVVSDIAEMCRSARPRWQPPVFGTG